MKSDYGASNIIEGRVDKFKFKTHKRFKEYYLKDNDYFERQSTHHALTLMNSGDTFIDVGAHHGYYSLIASKRVGAQGKIVAFEPVPDNRELLEANLSQIDPKIYKVYGYAVSNETGNAEFNIPWASDSAGLYKHPLAETLNIIKVELRALDDLFSDQKVDFVKIDTEGNELNVLKGMRGVIKNNPKIKLLIEFNPMCLRAANTNPIDLLNEISALGFDIYIVDEENSATLKLIDNDDWQKHLVALEYRNLLCVPKKTPSILLFAHNNALAGAELATVELASQLQSLGCLVTVSIPGIGKLNKVCHELNVSTTKHRSDWWINQKVLENTGTQLETEAIIQHYNYDSVLISTISNPIIPICARRTQKNVIWYIHEDITQFEYPYSHDQVAYYIESVADTILLTSKFLRSRLEEEWSFFKEAKILYPLPQYVNSGGQTVSTQSPGLLIIGSLEKNKNQMDALQALSILKKKGMTPQLITLGNGNKEYRKKLDDYVVENELNAQVKFIGEVNNPQEYISKKTILLSCSFHESFGRTIVEAFKAGSLVITSDNGGSRDFIKDKHNALVYEAGNAEQLAKLIDLAITKNSSSNITDNAHATYEMLKQEYHDQLMSLFRQLSNIGSEDNDQVEDKLNTNYINEIEENKSENIIENHLATIKELRSEYDKMVDDYKELIKTHQELIDSRAWRYSTKARKVIHPLRSKRRN